jgi:hypothetical protein
MQALSLAVTQNLVPFAYEAHVIRLCVGMYHHFSTFNRPLSIENQHVRFLVSALCLTIYDHSICLLF